MHMGMKEQQACRVFIEVFKPGLGNGFQQRYTYIVMLMFLNLAIVHSSSDVSVRTTKTILQEITFAFTLLKWINLSKNYVGTMP